MLIVIVIVAFIHALAITQCVIGFNMYENRNDDAHIPSWDGNPATWQRYREDVRVWKLGLNLDVPYSIAARMIMKLKGAARRKAITLKDEDLQGIRPKEKKGFTGTGHPS